MDSHFFPVVIAVLATYSGNGGCRVSSLMPLTCTATLNILARDLCSGYSRHVVRDDVTCHASSLVSRTGVAVLRRDIPKLRSIEAGFNGGKSMLRHFV